MDSRIEFSDLRGRKYLYSVRRFEDFWADVPGNYIFAKRTSSGWVPLYIGETASLQKRMARHHEAWDYCCNRGASFVLAHVNLGDHTERDAELHAGHDVFVLCVGVAELVEDVDHVVVTVVAEDRE